MLVDPERLARWLSGFAERHGALVVQPEAEGPTQVVRHTAADGAVADVDVPFPPLVGDLVDHALAERRVGLLLVRRGGHAAGVAEGRRLVASKVGRRLVQGRTAAGGWSQQRYARRRDDQARLALAAAADTAAAVLLPEAGRLEGLVLGGERGGVDTVLADRRLAALAPLVTGRLLDVPDPRQAVLAAAPVLLRQVRVRVRGPGGPSAE